ncbi:MAG: DNA recombination protein RmuC [Muribaculaceae bacterium]|nr:DNA recombination protein RmuC [Muribaculaceae bacterium]
MIAVYIVIGFIGGVLTGILILKGLVNKNQPSIIQLSQEKQRLEDSLAQSQISVQNLMVEQTRLQTQMEIKEASVIEMKENFRKEKEELENRRKESELAAENLRKENDKTWALRLEKLKEELLNLNARENEERQRKLQDSNREQIGEILKPIKEQFETFRKSVEETKTSNETAKNELKMSFEATMKLFEQQQNQVVESLKRETAKIGNDANNLTNALKRDSKKQGNWGEMILESLLDSSGLEKDRHYFIQETVKDEDGKFLRPDVIVKFPEGKAVIIDSKVSLTAYTESFETEDKELKKARLKDHAKSVKKHVDELSSKKYDDVVSDTIGFVLMFIPNDQCYLAALEEEPDLSRYAYEKHIVIISPSNLMMALQLAYNLWQQDVRNKNIDNIVKTANDLYDKVAVFSETMQNLENSIYQLSTTFQKAKTQMYEGKGNILRRMEKLKELGLNPKKQIKGVGDQL